MNSVLYPWHAGYLDTRTHGADTYGPDRKKALFKVNNEPEIRNIGVYSYQVHWGRESSVNRALDCLSGDLGSIPRGGCTDFMCALVHAQMESNWTGPSVCNWQMMWHYKGNTGHTRQTRTFMQSPLSPFAGCGPEGEGTCDKAIKLAVRQRHHLVNFTIIASKKHRYVIHDQKREIIK